MSDLIDRQAAIDATWEEPAYTDPINVLTEVRDRINKLPSEEPRQRKEANWIDITHHIVYRCSYCGYYVDVNNIRDYKFCPHCGARMEGNDD